MIGFALFLLLSVSAQLCLGGGNDAGKVGLYDLQIFETCEYNNELDTKMYVSLDKDGDDKLISGNFTLPFDVDPAMTFQINIDRWSGSEWKTDYYTQYGPLCEYANKVFSKLFNTIKGMMSPAIFAPQVCNIVKDTYIFTGLQAPADNVNIPTVMYSKYRGYLRMYKGKDEPEIGCFYAELEAKK